MTFKEMVFSAGSQDFDWNPDFPNSEVIGHVNGHNIVYFTSNNKNYYGMTSDTIKAWLITTSIEIGEEIQSMRTLPEYRKENLMNNLLFWLKSYLRKTLIMCDTMSNDDIAFIKHLSYSGRFKINWYNLKTKESIPYDGSVDHSGLSPYRGKIEPTDWRIVLEGNGSDWFREKMKEWDETGLKSDFFIS